MICFTLAGILICGDPCLDLQKRAELLEHTRQLYIEMAEPVPQQVEIEWREARRAEYECAKRDKR